MSWASLPGRGGLCQVSLMTAYRVERGASLAELLAVLALVGIATTTTLSGIGAWQAQARLQSAQRQVTQALIRARLSAYTRAADARVVVTAPTALELQRDGRPTQTISLPPDVVVASAPADNDVRFRASGLADNATLVLRNTATANEVKIIVNQRGVVR